MTVEKTTPRPPQEQIPSPLAESAPQQLYQEIQRSHPKLIGPDGKTQGLPVTVSEFLAQLNDDLCEGQWVALMQNAPQVSVPEAARILGVSRQFLIGQLKGGEIPYHMVGTHYRFYVKDVLAYQMQRDNQWRRGPDALPQAQVEEGLADREPPDDLRPTQQAPAAPPPQPEPPAPLPSPSWLQEPQSVSAPQTLQPPQSTPTPQSTPNTEVSFTGLTGTATTAGSQPSGVTQNRP